MLRASSPYRCCPQVIGVITSPKGAVLHDIQTTIARRFPRPILLWPVPVQGEGAAEKIAAAIAAMDRLPAPGIPRPDVLIVARGGGSLEDLMAFNEEVVLRAAAACRLPLISAVGHETDTTLIDFVSDRRAPTPTAAAEMAVPPRAELLADLAQKSARLLGGLARLTGERRLRLNTAGARLPDLPSLLGNARLRHGRPGAAPGHGAAEPAGRPPRRAGQYAAPYPGPAQPDRRTRRHAACHGAAPAHRADPVRARPAHRRHGADAPAEPGAAGSAHLREQRAHLNGLAARLNGASYQSVLDRGFALVRDAAGHPITSAGAVRPKASLIIRFADGEAAVTAAGKESSRQGALPL